MTPLEAICAIVPRCIIEMHPSWKNEEPGAVYAQTKQTVEVSEEEFKALSVQDHFTVKAGGMQSLGVIVAETCDQRDWAAITAGYHKKFLVTLAFLPAIE